MKNSTCKIQITVSDLAEIDRERDREIEETHTATTVAKTNSEWRKQDRDH